MAEDDKDLLNKCIEEMIVNNKLQFSSWNDVPYLECRCDCFSCPLDFTAACDIPRFNFLKEKHQELFL